VGVGARPAVQTPASTYGVRGNSIHMLICSWHTSDCVPVHFVTPGEQKGLELSRRPPPADGLRAGSPAVYRCISTVLLPSVLLMSFFLFILPSGSCQLHGVVWWASWRFLFPHWNKEEGAVVGEM